LKTWCPHTQPSIVNSTCTHIHMAGVGGVLDYIIYLLFATNNRQITIRQFSFSLIFEQSTKYISRHIFAAIR
jgi:hypothetical protein